MTDALISISTILVLTSPFVYVYSILRGEVRPHRTTRFVILLITALSAWSLFGSRGAGFWLAVASAVQALALFAASIKHGMGGWARLDISCLAIACIGIIVWQTTGKPVVGLYASILADFIGYVPAYIKTYKLPYSENWPVFAIDAIAALLSLLAVNQLSAYSAGYPVYILLGNLSMAVLIISRRKSVSRHCRARTI